MALTHPKEPCLEIQRGRGGGLRSQNFKGRYEPNWNFQWNQEERGGGVKPKTLYGKGMVGNMICLLSGLAVSNHTDIDRKGNQNVEF